MKSTGSRSSRRRAPRPDTVLRAAIAAVFAVALVSGAAFHLAGVDLAERGVPLLFCPFRAATDLPCPGCGMTRAFLHLGQLRVADAVAANAFAPILAGAMVLRLLRRRPARLRYRRARDVPPEPTRGIPA